MLSKVLGKIGALVKANAIIYMMVVQAVLLYGGNIWVVTYAIMTVLEGFHHRIVLRIAGM